MSFQKAVRLLSLTPSNAKKRHSCGCMNGSHPFSKKRKILHLKSSTLMKDLFITAHQNCKLVNLFTVL